MTRRLCCGLESETTEREWQSRDPVLPRSKRTLQEMPQMMPSELPKLRKAPLVQRAFIKVSGRTRTCGAELPCCPPHSSLGNQNVHYGHEHQKSSSPWKGQNVRGAAQSLSLQSPPCGRLALPSRLSWRACLPELAGWEQPLPWDILQKQPAASV